MGGPDARGHGRSEGVGSGYSSARLQADVRALVGALGLDRMTHRERLLSASPMLLPATGGRVPTEEDNVAAVDSYTHWDLALARTSRDLWHMAQSDPEALLAQVPCGWCAPGTTCILRIPVPTASGEVASGGNLHRLFTCRHRAVHPRPP